ncbi:MAG: anthranilate synthase component I [Phycisphaerales bacterium]|nr:anthranilate synthase component I [Phycisphaerales bacterium]
MIRPSREAFIESARDHDVVPIARRLMTDQLTPVLAYRRLVASDDRLDSSFLLESVEVGGQVGRFSLMGARPAVEVVVHGNEVKISSGGGGTPSVETVENPLEIPRRLTEGWRVAPLVAAAGEELPRFLGGWCGHVGYDAARWLEPSSLPWTSAPDDDRGLPDMHLGLYREVVVIDHVAKVVHVVVHVDVREHDSAEAAWSAGGERMDHLVERLQSASVRLPAGSVDLDPSARPTGEMQSTVTQSEFESIVETCKDYIRAGDIFQVVPSQRLERITDADPFAIYRALRIVNPSPYMIYMQSPEVVLVASSPEILCRVEGDRVTSRPLAGTRRRGRDVAEDDALEVDLLADDKERAEHAMLVDLARNDLGTVCVTGSVEVTRLMEVERYSHVMHLSSTVEGTLADGRDAWDALHHVLPVGTVSGAPKIRAMQIIDEVEAVRRGPYAGGMGFIDFHGDLDMAIALRTMVIPTPEEGMSGWRVHLQAGAGIVLDSEPAREYEETLGKAAALGRAIDLAEVAFGDSDVPGEGRVLGD